MIKALHTAPLALAVMLTLAGCGSTTSAAGAAGHAIKITDDIHHTIVLQKPAHHIVVLEPSNAEIALDLGLKSELAGIDTSTIQSLPAPWSHQLHGIKSIGPSFPGINVEEVVAAKPDLVITGTGVKGISSLAKFHIPVMTLSPTSIQGMYHDIMLVGRATGKTARAQKIIDQLKRQFRAIEAKVKTTKTRPTVFYDLGGLYTSGPHTFLNSIIDMAGARNVGASLSTKPWPLVTAEQVVRANPDDILIDGGSGTSVSHEEHLAGFDSTTAVKTGHVYEVTQPSYLDEPAPGLVEGLKELIHLIHPTLRLNS